MFHCNFNYVSKGLYIKYARRGQMVFVGGGGEGVGGGHEKFYTYI